MEVIKSANLALRFILEVCALGAVGYWGFQLDRSSIVKWIAGIGAPLLVIVVWLMFIAPGSDGGLSATTKMWLGSAVLAGCAGALAAARYPVLAGLFVLAIVANSVLMHVWEQ